MLSCSEFYKGSKQLTCSEAEFVLLLALVVVERPDSHASVHVFVEGVEPPVRVLVGVGAGLLHGGRVGLVLLITADGAKIQFAPKEMTWFFKLHCQCEKKN